MTAALAAGLAAGVLLGYVLQRGQLCFHATVAEGLTGRGLLARGWLLGVALASVGLALLYAFPVAGDLNRGLAFRPVENVVGGLVIGAGMAVARSCVSGLFYKLGAGMLGALVGLGGWVAGELTARLVDVPGPTLLASGTGATVPGLLGVPRSVVAGGLLAVVLLALRARPGTAVPAHPWQWGWRRLGVALGAVTVAGWLLAALGGAGFGPSTVGASAGVAGGRPPWWLLAFLAGLVAGAAVAARTAGGFAVRGERPARYVQLAVGGVLLGAGGWVAGGCNLGHGLSGVAQLNVSSWVVVVSIVAGVGATRALQRRVGRPDPVRQPG